MTEARDHDPARDHGSARDDDPARKDDGAPEPTIELTRALPPDPLAAQETERTLAAGSGHRPSALDAARHQRGTELFLEALERDPAQRSAWIERACGDDVELRRTVEEMLLADADSAGFLEGSATDTLALVETVSETLLVREGLAPGEDVPAIPGVSIQAVIGRGGQGVVYHGRQNYVDRDVAVKVLCSGADTTFADRFQREAKILAGLQHRFIVGCYQAGVNDSGQCFIVMELIDGPDLGRWIKEQGALAPEDALTLVRDVALALQYAHTVNVIHRDVKPQNVLLQPTLGGQGAFAFRAKLADLGLARATEGDLPGMLTAPGSVIGTPATMALEQIDDPDSVDFRADIYGLGCVLYHALAGVAAYAGMPPAKVFRKKAQDPPPDIRKAVPRLPRSIAALVRSMMDADRTRRPQSYAELIARFEQDLAALEGPATQAGESRRPLWRRVVPALAGIALVALVVLRWGADSSPAPPEAGRPASAAGDRGAADLVVAPPRQPSDDASAGDAGSPELPGDSDGESAGESTRESTGRPAPPLLEPALARGEKEVLFAAWDDLEGLLAGWERNPPGVWACFEGELDQPQVRTAAGTATRALPAGSWSLTGEVLVKLPFGWEADAQVLGGVRIGFGPDRALQFALALADGEARWSLVSRDGETWKPSGVALDLAPVPFGKNDWVAFRVASDGPTLRLQIGAGPEWEADAAAIGLEGPATTVSLTAQGLVRWRDFVLRGR